MIVDLDYGIIPGTQKPTLLKPGAEKIAKLLGLSDQYEILDKVENWTEPLFRYLIKCRLVHLATNAVISEGLGECNSMESKYRWRDAKRKCPECGAEAIIKGKEQYGGGWICFGKIGGCGEKWPDGDAEIEDQKIGRVENEDIYSQVNTILKMAKKRALVDAALSAGRLSDIFTQDMEDISHIKIGKQPDLVRDEDNGESQEESASPARTRQPEAHKTNIDMDWLKESLEKLKWTDVSKWLKERYKNAKGTTIKELVESLTLEQQEYFVKQVQDRLEIQASEAKE